MSQIEIDQAELLAKIPAVVRVAETKNFSEAGRQLGLSPSAISKSISRLEEQLGVRLFHRTTRQMSLTEEGQQFYQRCRQVLSDVEEATALATRSQVLAEGTVRATIPVSLGREHLVPALPKLQELHPGTD